MGDVMVEMDQIKTVWVETEFTVFKIEGALVGDAFIIAAVIGGSTGSAFGALYIDGQEQRVLVKFETETSQKFQNAWGLTPVEAMEKFAPIIKKSMDETKWKPELDLLAEHPSHRRDKRRAISCFSFTLRCITQHLEKQLASWKGVFND